MGRSPRLVTVTRAAARPELISMGADSKKYSPGIMISANGLMNRYKLGSVRECTLDLNLTDHFRNAFHNVVGREYLRSQAHEFGNGLAVANLFQQRGSDQGDRFGIVEFQSPILALPRHLTC